MKFRVTIEDQTYDVEVGNLQARPVMVMVDGDSFSVWPESGETHTVATASATGAPCPSPVQPVIRTAEAASTKTVLAPIPGTIVGVSAKPGDSVQVGQVLCTLEAMKMKNAIRATRAGTIAKVFIANGDSVKHGQPLVEFSD